jgi:hypothetical protein
MNNKTIQIPQGKFAVNNDDVASRRRREQVREALLNGGSGGSITVNGGGEINPNSPAPGFPSSGIQIPAGKLATPILTSL